MNIILFDHPDFRINLQPLSFTRPIADMRVGILTIKEKWNHYIPGSYSFMTEDFLSEKYPVVVKDENLFINASVLPDEEIIKEMNQLKSGFALWYNGYILAYRGSKFEEAGEASRIDYPSKPNLILHPWDIFSKNGEEIAKDFNLMTNGRRSANVSKGNFLRNEENIFVEEGAKVDHAYINASNGPVYIGKNASIMAGSLIEGPFALCDHATVKLGTKIYGPTTIGPWCKVGGEINNVVFHSYSSKAHDGFLGNAVIGQWCNIGADSNNSNLKNTYDVVKMWNYGQKRFISSELQFCGLVMGDHSKCGINTMFNTGTVIGVHANIYGSGFPRNFIPSFAWGGNHGFSEYNFQKACKVTEKVMLRRNIDFDEIEQNILKSVFEQTGQYRTMFNT